MPNFRVLVFPCGAENALELHGALSRCVNVELWGASSRDDHGRYVFRNYFGGVPYIDEPSFLKMFNEQLLTHKIDLVFPTHDTVALRFAELRAGLACRAVTADTQTALICREKRKTYELFAGCSFLPRVYSTLAEVTKFPVFLKPNIGEGGKHTRLASSREEAAHAMALGPDLLIVEYLPGDELTVDCFTDRHRKLRFVGARERGRVNYGISVHSKTVELTAEIEAIAQGINNRLAMRGLWFFQVKRAADGKYKLLEVSARVAGTMCLYRHCGVNLPLLSVYDAMDMEVEIPQHLGHLEVDRALFNRFRVGFEYDSIYLDFDDTVICRGEVDSNVLLLLYQAASQGKPVHLLTRHDGDILAALHKAKIYSGLFAQIHTLKWHEEKHPIVAEAKKPIFIDNAFIERKKVQERLGIPVFDVDAVGCLLDWRS